jgi:tRNA (guanine10-N2)-methyltransferase
MERLSSRSSLTVFLLTSTLHISVILLGEIIHLTSIYSRKGYIPPKRPYGFEAMQRDILEFAVRRLVPNGRLAMWMPTASDEAVEFPVPMHPNLEVISVCVQPFTNCE